MSNKNNYDFMEMQCSKLSREEIIEALTSKCEEYERLFNNYEKKDLEIERLHSIIKEVREYIEKCSILGINEVDRYCMDYDVRDDLLGILDKDITKKLDYNYEKVEGENKE